MYVPFNFVSVKVLSSKGLRTSITVGCILTIIGCWVRSLQIWLDFYAVLVGTIIAAAANPFLLNTVSKVAFNWFGDKERAMATAVGSMSMPLGMLISFILPSMIFDDSDKDNIVAARDHF